MSSGKVVLVTGASSGFGKSIAYLLSEKGYKVFGTSRKPKHEPNSNLEMLKLDVNSDKSVDSCVSSLIKKTGRIDILVNNAGYISSGALEENSIEDAKAQFETNFFGAVRMVNSVLPIMRKQKSGQIINISSLAATFPAPFRGFYSATKAALLSYSESLRLEVKGLGIKVSVVEPGVFSTNLFKNPRSSSKKIADYARTQGRVMSRPRSSASAGDPSEVAATVLKIIQSRSPRLHYPVGRERHFLIVKKVLPDSILESGVRKYWGLDG